MTARINARISADLARKLTVLRRRTGKSITEIVAASLEAYYAGTAKQPQPAMALLGEFIGSGDADPGLSEDYKAALREDLDAKVRRR